MMWNRWCEVAKGQPLAYNREDNDCDIINTREILTYPDNILRAREMDKVIHVDIFFVLWKFFLSYKDAPSFLGNIEIKLKISSDPFRLQHPAPLEIVAFHTHSGWVDLYGGLGFRSSYQQTHQDLELEMTLCGLWLTWVFTSLLSQIQIFTCSPGQCGVHICIDTLTSRQLKPLWRTKQTNKKCSKLPCITLEG